MGRNWYLLLTLVRSLDTISYVLMAVLCIRNFRVRRTRWGGAAYCALIVTYALLYLNIVADEAVRIATGQPSPFNGAADIVTSVLVALFVFHAFYNGERQYLRAPGFWKAFLGLSYAIGVASVAAGLIQGLHRRLLIPFNLQVPPPVVLAAIGVFGLLCTSRRPASAPVERRRRIALLALCVAWPCVVIAWRLTRAPAWHLAKDICPLVFLFIVTYYVERFAFFDVLIKKGVAAFLSLALLAVYFTWLGPWMLRFRLSTLVWALSAWPIVLVNPWIYRWLSAWLDRLWLGRRFTPIEASEHFLDGLQGAISEPELAALAEQRLRTIFQSEAEVLVLPLADAPGPETQVRVCGPLQSRDREGADSMQAPIRLSGRDAGAIRVRPRPHNPRFLSEDVALLASLAEVFSYLLENLRLRERRLEHEKREQELLLNANRSELKALRAQVNPHFLFNALNTIASLIPRHPDRAEKTIEQLAEVFRYTLRRSDREWVTLDEELEAVRAYLDVEQERFGDRLTVRLSCAEEARSVRIPAMVVQTLVENAVKHGVSAIRTQAVVEIEAGVSPSGVSITVRDNGPGFPAPACALEAGDGGYGLRNIRERLQGHFGDAAGLAIDRDAALGMTVVTVQVPRTVGQASACRVETRLDPSTTREAEIAGPAEACPTSGRKALTDRVGQASGCRVETRLDPSTTREVRP